MQCIPRFKLSFIGKAVTADPNAPGLFLVCQLGQESLGRPLFVRVVLLALGGVGAEQLVDVVVVRGDALDAPVCECDGHLCRSDRSQGDFHLRTEMG